MNSMQSHWMYMPYVWFQCNISELQIWADLRLTVRGYLLIFNLLAELSWAHLCDHEEAQQVADKANP